MKKLKIFFPILLVIASLTFFAGCQKEDAPEPTSLAKEHKRQALHALAKALVQDSGSEGTLKKRQIALYGETSVEEFLLLDLKEKGLEPRTPSIIYQLLAQNPLMEIAYPSFAFFESSETFEQHLDNIQYYVVVDNATDPESESVTTLPAYDANGNAVQIANSFDESVRYAVIAMDEAHDAVIGEATQTVKGRTVPNSLANFSPSWINGNVKYYEEATVKNAEYQDAGNPNVGTVNPVNFLPPDCDRPAGKKDQLRKIRFSNKDAVKVIESGFRLPRVELNITYAITSVTADGQVVQSTYFTQVDKKWKDMTDGSWDNVDAINQQIQTWLSTHADTWGVLIVEDDGGNSGSYTLGVSPRYTVDEQWQFTTTINYTIPVRSKDDIAGNVIIEFCDPAEGEGTAYKVYTGGNDGMYMR